MPSRVRVDSGRANWPIYVSRVTLPGHGERIRLEVSSKLRLDFTLDTIPALCNALVDLAEAT